MKARAICAVVVMGVAMWRTAGAGGSRTPEQLGAHWARVSDEAQIQLLVDELRSGGGAEGKTRKYVPALFPDRQSAAASRSAQARQSSASSAEQATDAAGGWKVKVAENTASVDFATGERLQFEKRDGRWRVTGGAVPPSFRRAQGASGQSLNVGQASSGVSVGETFVPMAVSQEHGIERLTKRITQTRLGRQLFGAAGKVASYYTVRYMRSAPFVIATYIQLVADPEWDRILYGNMDKWIKTFSVQSPSAIAVDADGNVFVGEPANKRVLVLKLVGSGDNVTLQYDHHINNITNPTDLALNDNGTPLNTNDDFIYIADASLNKIFKYTAGAHANVLRATFDGFSSPTSIAVGRWNGANENILYVIDKIAKRIRVFDDEGSALARLAEYAGDYSQYFTSIKTDHFGNVYVVDNVNSKLLKFTGSLDLLDEQGGDGTYAAPANIDVPFGKIVVDGEGMYWTGFDQLFAIERWDNGSGVVRRKFGLRLKDIAFGADADVSAVRNDFVLTDVGNVRIRIYDDTKRLVRNLTSSWMLAGQKNLQWDRRSDDGTQVPPGTYRYEISAASVYGDESRGDEPTISTTRFYLPLYYHEDCGSAHRQDDAHLVQGSVVAWGTSPSQTASEHGSSVHYRFAGLNPASEYEVAAEFAAGDGVQRLQELAATVAETRSFSLTAPVRIGANPVATGFIKLPKESYANGELTISVNRLGEGSAIVTQLWLKESGAGFNPQPIATIPTKYKLEQNFPNPFNPTTTIRFALPSDGFVTLKVYNIMGQEVATLVNEPKVAGKYEIRFDAKNVAGNSLASGVYLYRVTSRSSDGQGSFSEVKKMVLLK
jgi:hypothetical protein